MQWIWLPCNLKSNKLKHHHQGICQGRKEVPLGGPKCIKFLDEMAAKLIPFLFFHSIPLYHIKLQTKLWGSKAPAMHLNYREDFGKKLRIFIYFWLFILSFQNHFLTQIILIVGITEVLTFLKKPRSWWSILVSIEVSEQQPLDLIWAKQKQKKMRK